MKIPIEIHSIKNPNGTSQFKAIVPLEYAIKDSSINNQLVQIQNEYSNIIKNCKSQIQHIQSKMKSRANPILKWNLADAIYLFLKSLEKRELLLANIAEALSRDLELSRREIDSLIKFRTNYPNITLINKDISWGRYRELLDLPNNTLRKKFIEKIIKGDLKTRDDIRKYKKELIKNS